MGLDQYGLQIPSLLLPKHDVDFSKWAVIACDQFTSQPEYWSEVANIVGDNPSTYHLVLPEIMLGTSEEDARLQAINRHMTQYLNDDLLIERKGIMYVERTYSGKKRRGIMLAVDLEKYDFHPSSKTLIRATEGTILERLPPRIKIREKAKLELPHILLLIDDPEDLVMKMFEVAKNEQEKYYDFELMLRGGHLEGWFFENAAFNQKLENALRELADLNNFQKKYNLRNLHDVLLFAVGDGNHSLATAKSVWQKIKGYVPSSHPARYALVEIENVHDPALEFHPIHRLLINLDCDILKEMQGYYFGKIILSDDPINEENSKTQYIQYISEKERKYIYFLQSSSNLTVGTLQPFLDEILKQGKIEKIDYIHGDDVLEKLAIQKKHAGFILPEMPKSELFKTVILDGVLPRKTFSMGEAQEKRYYMEAKFIQ